MVGYFLDYYGNHALEHLGWMETVSRALPFLYIHNLEHYVRDLFYKECFADKDLDNNYSIDDLLSNEEKLIFQQTQFKAFQADTKLSQTDMKHLFTMKKTMRSFIDFIAYHISYYFLKLHAFLLKKLFINEDIKPHPIILRIFPLPNFTVNDLPTPKLQELIDDIKNLNRSDFLVFLKNVFKHIFIPRGYQVNRKNKKKLSPLTQIVNLKEDIIIFDNPAMEAVIDFKWKWASARLHFIHSFILFSLYAVDYCYLCYAYIIQQSVDSIYHNFLLPLVIYFYYAAYYLSFIKWRQMRYYGNKKYFLNIYNIFDLITLFTSVSLMSICLGTSFDLQTGFNVVNTLEPTLVTLMSFSALLIWCEFVSRSIYLEGGGVDEKTK